MFRFLKVLLVCVILFAAGYFAYTTFFSQGAEPQQMQGGAAPVSVAEVIKKNLRQWREFSGRLVAVESAEIRPQVSGTIEKIHFEEGAYVKKGDLLFTLDQRPYKAALDAAQARYNLADIEFKRATGLIEKKIVPQSEYDKRKNNVAVARADLKQAKVDYDYTLIRAPISGRVSRAEITVGNLVTAGSNAPMLTRIVSDKPIYADFDIDERAFLEYLQAAGTNMQRLKDVPVYLGLSDQDDVPYEGHVQSFDNQLNPQTGTLRVRAIFENADGTLVPGLFARIHLGGPEERETLLITDRAIGTDQNKKFVMVLGPENKVEYREVTLDGNADGLRIVLTGLKEGEKIVVNGLQRARPGATVMPELVPMNAPESSPQQTSAAGEKETP